jgi:hypothetical protein
MHPLDGLLQKLRPVRQLQFLLDAGAVGLDRLDA